MKKCPQDRPTLYDIQKVFSIALDESAFTEIEQSGRPVRHIPLARLII
jgi:hypothetical protein